MAIMDKTVIDKNMERTDQYKLFGGLFCNKVENLKADVLETSTNPSF